MESAKEYNNTAAVAMEIQDDMEAPNNHKDTNNKDIKDANLDVISDTVGETLNIEDGTIVSTDARTDSSSKSSSSCFSRLCCCFNDCTKQKFLVIAMHVFILIIALLCLIPTGVMKEVMRARMANIATLVWIIYCIIMILINISYYFHRRKHDMSKSSREEEVDVDEDMSKSQEVDVEDQTSNNYRVASTCNKMGCLCFTTGPYISPTNTRKCCFKKATCYRVVIALLIIEGILLLSPVFASLSTYNNIDVELNTAFPEVVTYPPPDPKIKAFSFGNYLLPGVFSMNGGYTNQNDNVKTFKYKDGCSPDCELDIHLPKGDIPISGYPIIFEVHGGGWDSGAKSATKIPLSYWTNRGYAFVSIQYRFPSRMEEGSSIWEQLDDVEDALNYIIENGEEQGLDTSRILMTGDSAGGHLACVVSYRSEVPSIKGVMNFYGATEWKYYFDTGGKLLGMLLDKLLPDGGSDDDFKAASCSTYVTPTSPPLLSIHGTWDVIVPLRLSEYLHSVFDDLGVSNLLLKMPTSDHVLELGYNSLGGQPSIYAMERFVAATIGEVKNTGEEEAV